MERGAPLNWPRPGTGAGELRSTPLPVAERESRSHRWGRECGDGNRVRVTRLSRTRHGGSELWWSAVERCSAVVCGGLPCLLFVTDGLTALAKCSLGQAAHHCTHARRHTHGTTVRGGCHGLTGLPSHHPGPELDLDTDNS